MPKRPIRNGYEIGNYVICSLNAPNIELEVAKSVLEKEINLYQVTNVTWSIKRNCRVLDPKDQTREMVVDLVAYKGFVSVPHHLQQGTA